MEAHLTHEIKVHLTLNEEEAIWLKNFVQNDFSGCETEQEEKMREALFKALTFPT